MAAAGDAPQRDRHGWIGGETPAGPADQGTGGSKQGQQPTGGNAFSAEPLSLLSRNLPLEKARTEATAARVLMSERMCFMSQFCTAGKANHQSCVQTVPGFCGIDLNLIS